MFLALRSLGTTVLGVHHEPVSVQRERGAKPTPYGNRYFNNETRWSWWIRASDPDNHGTRTLALHHDKANVGPRWRRPIGLILTWKDDIPILSRNDDAVTDSPELTEKMKPRDKIRLVLRRGEMSVKDIADRLEAKPDNVRKLLERNPKFFTRIGTNWGLLQ